MNRLSIAILASALSFGMLPAAATEFSCKTFLSAFEAASRNARAVAADAQAAELDELPIPDAMTSDVAEFMRARDAHLDALHAYADASEELYIAALRCARE